jgi:lactate dehydrogenase-like 2-hydroxyacid dehydrogenase
MTEDADVTYDYFPTLLALARWADVLIVAARASPQNADAVDSDILAALGPEGYVVNVARGSLIDDEALSAALRNNTIAGAALDVVDGEPNVSASLLSSPNIVLTPHIGGATKHAERERQRMVLANVSAFFAGDPLPTPVPMLREP